MGDTSFIIHTFNSLTWADVSQLSEKRDEIVWTPSQEGFNNEWSFQITAPIVDISASSMIPEFKELQMSVAAGERRNYCVPKAPLPHQELAQREFGPQTLS